MGQQVDDLWMGNATGPQTAGWSNGGNPGVIGRGVGPLGRTYLFDIVPAAAAANAVCAAQAVAGAGALTINGASATGGVATFDVARAVNVDTSSANNTAVGITVTGTDYYGQPQTELIVTDGTTAVDGKKAFKSITAVSSNAAAVGTVTVGSTDVFGLPYYVRNAGYLLRIGWDNALADDTSGTFVAGDTTSPATATTGDVRGTFTPSSAANGSRRLVIAIGLTAIQAGPTATQTAAIGVTPA